MQPQKVKLKSVQINMKHVSYIYLYVSYQSVCTGSDTPVKNVNIT